MVYGISGITDVNLIEGYNPQKGIFDKSKTNMRDKTLLLYCRIGDPRIKKLIIDEGRLVKTRSAKLWGIEMLIENTDIVLANDEFEGLLHAMSYPLHYQEKNKKLRPLLMMFDIGKHRVNDVKYTFDCPIVGRDENRNADYFCSNKDYSSSSGYYLEPGIVKVKNILEIKEEGKHPNAHAQKSFRLINVNEEFST